MSTMHGQTHIKRMDRMRNFLLLEQAVLVRTSGF